mmetsp:Transcript_49662/g.144392  ORF Transcript_49662/g.144392 Transcript_49662/m.144392 type:complete len:309 (+) Transcript_49662:390-1316(+)
MAAVRRGRSRQGARQGHGHGRARPRSDAVDELIVRFRRDGHVGPVRLYLRHQLGRHELRARRAARWLQVVEFHMGYKSLRLVLRRPGRNAYRGASRQEDVGHFGHSLSPSHHGLRHRLGRRLEAWHVHDRRCEQNLHGPHRLPPLLALGAAPPRQQAVRLAAAPRLVRLGGARLHVDVGHLLWPRFRMHGTEGCAPEYDGPALVAHSLCRIEDRHVPKRLLLWQAGGKAQGQWSAEGFAGGSASACIFGDGVGVRVQGGRVLGRFGCRAGDPGGQVVDCCAARIDGDQSRAAVGCASSPREVPSPAHR